MSECTAMTLRPGQLMCAVCSLDEDDCGAIDPESRGILEAVQKTPDMPITLKCHVGEVFAYGDFGTPEDAPEGEEFSDSRDLDILCKLNLFPGATLPARLLFHRLLDTIEQTTGVCGYSSVTSDAWKGCPRAGSGCYERGRSKGIDAIIPPRPEQEMEEEKQVSLAAMHEAEAIGVRPHILLCAVCQYGQGIRPPYREDNLPELLELMLKKPDTRIRLVPRADWAMCAPCPWRVSEHNACIIHKGSGGLPNQMKDLRVLQKLGLTFGSTMNARDLYKLIFERISGTPEVCRIECPKPSVWWDPCADAVENEDYEKGKRRILAEMGSPPV